MLNYLSSYEIEHHQTLRRFLNPIIGRYVSMMCLFPHPARHYRALLRLCGVPDWSITIHLCHLLTAFFDAIDAHVYLMALWFDADIQTECPLASTNTRRTASRESSLPFPMVRILNTFVESPVSSIHLGIVDSLASWHDLRDRFDI